MGVVRRILLRGAFGGALFGAGLGACSDSSGDAPPAGTASVDGGVGEETGGSGGDGGEDAKSNPTDGASTDAAPSCTGKSSFTPTETAFPLPTGYTPPSLQAVFPALGGALTCASGANAPQYSAIDLDGDKRLDIVVTRRCNDAAIGNTKWLFYKNSGSGFSATPTDFTLPTGYTSAAGNSAFGGLGGALGCVSANVPDYTTMDVDGDGRPDLVVTRRCNDTATGTSKWLVYKNTGTGFAAATDFALPTGYTAAAFKAVGGALDCNGVSVPEFTTFDVDGDRRPDLLVSRRCGELVTGNAHWLLYKNNGAGFAAATNFTLPTGYTTNSIGSFTFPTLGSTSITCASGANVPAYTTTDLDGDGHTDLVVTRRCNDAATGNTKWHLHKGGATGFATTPADFSLPSGYATGGLGVVFNTLGNGPAASCTNGANLPVYTTTDLDGDSRPDIVVTRRCNDFVTGNSKWLLYKSSASGFAAAPTDFALPTGYTSGAVGLVFGTFGNAGMSCASGANIPAFTLADLDGDGRTDIAVTRRCADSASGNSKWLLYKNVCTP